MMDQLISQFPEQLKEAIAIGEAATINKKDGINNVYVAGMGGSGIGANFVASFIREESKIPYLVGKGYDVPNYIDENTLAIASSYSGNTEETLFSFEQMIEKGAKVVVIASGGKLIEKAKALDLDYIQVPPNSPSPRACLGYSMIQQLFILNKMGLISSTVIDQMRNSIQLLVDNQEAIKVEAKAAAEKLHGKIVCIYTTDRTAPVALRFRQQVNENSKCLAWEGIIPEQNHNELVGWTKSTDQLAAIYFRNKNDRPRNQKRIEINKTILGRYIDTILEVYSKGDNQVAQSIYLVHFGDWISWYLAELGGVDAIEINVIDFLKGELAKS